MTRISKLSIFFIFAALWAMLGAIIAAGNDATIFTIFIAAAGAFILAAIATKNEYSDK